MLLVGAAAALAVLLTDRQSGTGLASASPSTSSRPAPAPTDRDRTPYAGLVVAVEPTTVTSECSAPPATDDSGDVVRYDVELVLDEDPQTAWRCSGSGVDTTIVFGFADEVEIVEVGLVNGYAKVDPRTNTRRYAEYRRVTEVVWSIGELDVVQRLADDDESLQPTRIPAQRVREVTLTIEDSTGPGSSRESGDAVLISEIRFGAPG